MKNIFKIISKTIMLLIITGGLVVVLSPLFRLDYNPDGDNFRNLPENSIDIMVFGSSQVQYSINPAVINAETGYYTYILGSPCQPMPISYEFIVEALKTQKPEVVLVDVFTLLPASNVCSTDGIYYTAILQMTGINKFRAATYVETTETKLDYMFDLRMNHSNWKRKEFTVFPKKIDDINSMLGYVVLEPEEMEFRKIKQFEVTEKIELNQNVIDILDKIIRICEENNIELVFIKTPFIIDQENQNYLSAVWKYVDSRNSRYVDFIEKQDDINFGIGMDGDTWHNTYLGAEKVSKGISEYIVENNLVTKHKQNTKMDEYNESLKSFAGELLMTKQIDIYKLLDYAKKYNCTLVVKYEGNKRTSIREYENQLLNEAGLTHDFIKDKNNDYYAIIENGKVISESNKPLVMNSKQGDIVIGNKQIKIGEQLMDNLGELEIVFCSNDMKVYQSLGINYASNYFWKNECNGYVCE